MSARPNSTVSAAKRSMRRVRKVDSRQRGSDATAANAEAPPIRSVIPSP